MKNKFLIIGSAILAVVLVVILIITLIPAKPVQEPVKDPVNSNVSTATVTVEDIEKNDEDTSSTTSGDFIEPNESEADKILEENKTTSKNTSSTTSETKKPENKKTESTKTTTSKDKPQSFEDSKQELENTATDYLKKHNINPKTAGETGETCPHCGKKIWNPDKYGLCIPGMPDNYENSGYCLGTCAITFG